MKMIPKQIPFRHWLAHEHYACEGCLHTLGGLNKMDDTLQTSLLLVILLTTMLRLLMLVKNNRRKKRFLRQIKCINKKLESAVT